jgi:hypothetical protein
MTSSKPSGTTTVTQSNDPWSGQQEYLKDVFTQAQQQYQAQQPAYFPASTVVPLSGQTETALAQQESRAMAGSPLTRQAQQQVASTMAGDYLSAGNPYFSAMTERVAEGVLPKVSAQFSASGRYGSPSAQRAASLGMTDALGSLAYQNYGAERQAQQAATAMAPQMAMQDYADIGQLAAVGQAREAQAGAELQDQIARWNAENQQQQDKLARYASLVAGGQFGGSQTTNQPVYSNPLQTYGGLGLGAIGAAGSLFGQGGIFPGGAGVWK